MHDDITEMKRDIGLDCGDHSCRYAVVRTGMRTNGGCRCEPPAKQIADLARRLEEARAQKRQWTEHRQLTDAELRDPEYMAGYVDDFFHDFGLQTAQVVELKAKLAALEQRLAEHHKSADEYITRTDAALARWEKDNDQLRTDLAQAMRGR